MKNMFENIKVAITCGYIGEHECYQPLRDAGIEYRTLNDWNQPYTEALQYADCIFAGGERFNQKTFEAMPNLKFIIRHGIGYDAIDLEAASKAGVAVANLPGCSADSVAEFTLALLLAVNQKIVPYHHACTGKGPWPQEMARALEGTVGLIGFGAIARSFVKFTKPFPLDKIMAYDPYVNASVMKQHGVEKCELSDIRREADIISLHTPWTKETYQIINRDFLNGLEKKVTIINTARGQLIDNDALGEALENGKIIGAGLDVLDGLAPPESPLYKLPNVVLTPHVATNNLRCRIITNELGVQAILNFFSGKIVKSILNPAYIENARYSI
jgi:phosphoglycerate dehydrogenase-like enzyme